MATVRKHVEPSKELELLNFKAFQLENPEHFVRKKTRNDVKKWNSNNKISPVLKYVNNEGRNQFTAFQGAMKYLLIYGQCLALNPVTGILDKDVTKLRFRWLSFKVLYTLILGVAQAISAVLCIYRVFGESITIRGIAFCSFYMCTTYTNFMFLRVATKWTSLMKELHNCGLDEYADKKLNFKCYLAFFILLFLAFLEHFFSEVAKFVETLDCATDDGRGTFEKFIRFNLPWIYNLGVGYTLPVGILLQMMIVISSLCWSYSDVFIICVSLYLTSVLNCINLKIKAAQKNNYLPPSFWRSLREDYNRATQLVRSFDDRISGIVFVSFANNLFFICLQLFYSLANGLRKRQQFFEEHCPNYPSGPFGGYEANIYLIYSLSFLSGKFLAVSVIASGVNTASVESAPALYNIASSMYCSEVQRFLDQVHGDTIALSGFKFFYVTREMILSVAGTIVTYELVLLQFGD